MKAESASEPGAAPQRAAVGEVGAGRPGASVALRAPAGSGASASGGRAAGGGALPEPPPERRKLALRRPPSDTPKIAINVLVWSPADERRFAFVSVDGGSMTRVREGDEIAGLRVERIYRDMIEFAHGGSTFLLRAN